MSKVADFLREEQETRKAREANLGTLYRRRGSWVWFRQYNTGTTNWEGERYYEVKFSNGDMFTRHCPHGHSLHILDQDVMVHMGWKNLPIPTYCKEVPSK